MAATLSPQPITELLARAADGNSAARERLWDQVYPELRAIAHRELSGEAAGRTVQTTSLVNEAYIRLVSQSARDWKSRVHFYAVSATVMRHLLIDLARRRVSAKRGGGRQDFSLDETRLGEEVLSEELLDLGEALERLAGFDPRAARVVDCRFFSGLTVAETSAALGISARTVKSDWAAARLWLLRELRK